MCFLNLPLCGNKKQAESSACFLLSSANGAIYPPNLQPYPDALAVFGDDVHQDETRVLFLRPQKF